jgi:hypothetical protein
MPRSAWALLLGVGLAGGACAPEDESSPTPPLEPIEAGIAGQGGTTHIDGGSPVVCGSGSGGKAGTASRGAAASPLPGPLSGLTVTAEVPPPPISGGTLLATGDGTQLVAADPDRDQLYFVDSADYTLLHVQKLNEGDEPGRLVEDGAGRIHVVLRGGRGIATLSREAGSPITRRELCELPRGLAYDSAHDSLQVACADGKLVSVPAAGGAATRTLDIGRDARDVIVRGDRTFVTHFRSAELISIGADGNVSAPHVPPTFSQLEAQVVPDPDSSNCGSIVETTVDNTPTVAWRALDVPGQGVVMLHQRARVAEVQVTEGGYGGGGSCGPGIVKASITTGMDEGGRVSADLGSLGLAVDMAVDPDGVLLAVVAPGNWGVTSQVQVFPMLAASSEASPVGADGGAAAADAAEAVPQRAALDPAGPQPGQPCLFPNREVDQPEGQATAVAFASPYMLAVQEREPAGISFIDTRTGTRRARLDLQQPTRLDTGHVMFHQVAGAGIACASCHAEGGDDSHVWSFHGIGARRTQNLRGGILGTEPFHWNGDMKDFPTLVNEVFIRRMGGFMTTSSATDALAHWIDEQPELHVAAADPDGVERGKQLFESAAVGCASCHSGALFTNNQLADVGTGAKLQVPALRGLSLRGPWMHDGCAKTLLERFGACGGGDKHGQTSQLNEAELGDLVSYLETL